MKGDYTTVTYECKEERNSLIPATKAWSSGGAFIRCKQCGNIHYGESRSDKR